MNILITSVGRRTYMIEYFRKALSGRGKVFASNSEITFALKQADEYILCPPIYDDSYIEFLLNYCRKKEISALISLFDIDLPILSKSKHLFDAIGVKLLISDYSFISVCNDKWLFYKFILSNGFRSPLTFVSLSKAMEAIKDGKMQYPLIIKPRWGMGSLSIFEADNKEELELFYKKTRKEILKSYLKYESQDLIEEGIIIQEKITGEEWGLDIFNDLSGNFLTCVPKRKIAMRAGETDVAVTSSSSDLFNLGKSISDKTNHIGNLDVDFFIKNNTYYILEFNGRFGGQYPFSHIAGVDFPKVLIDLIYNNEINLENLKFEEVMAYKDLEIRRI